VSKILWLSDGGCSTGFGRVTHEIGERLVRDYGHEIHVLATNYRGDAYPGLLDPSRPTPLYLYSPTQLDPKDVYGMSRIIEMLGRVEPDVVVSLNDPQVLTTMLFANKLDPQRVLLGYRPIISYLPCDGINLPMAWQILGLATNVLAMSSWGAQQYPTSRVVYHGVDSEHFWPVSDQRPIRIGEAVLRTKVDCKRALGFGEDAFVVGRVDTNSERKDYAATWKALVPFMNRHPEVRAHFHCSRRPGVALGVDFDNLFSRVDEPKADRFHFPETHTTFAGWPQAHLNALYNAFDVFISTSHGEGAGMTLMEAAACGIPIVAQNVSAIPEYVGPGAILLEPERLTTVPSGEDQWLPDIDAFSSALERLYRSRRMRRELGAAGREHVSQFGWETPAEQFDEYIGALAAMPKAEPASMTG
jgi:glycosyltransferase involved in cell wall biosynthesis